SGKEFAFAWLVNLVISSSETILMRSRPNLYNWSGGTSKTSRPFNSVCGPGSTDGTGCSLVLLVSLVLLEQPANEIISANRDSFSMLDFILPPKTLACTFRPLPTRRSHNSGI